MKLYSKLSAMGAALLLTTAFASADTLTLGSWGNAAVGTPSNTAVLFTGHNVSVAPGVVTNNAPAGTFNISSGVPTAWKPAGPNSSWVSYNAGTGPTGNFIAPNGTYTYKSSFTTTGGVYNGSLTVLADDTTDVYLNGVLVIPSGIVGSDAHCSDNGPTCLIPDTFSFGSSTAGFNSNGFNLLTFNVKQTGLVYEGLDFYGSTSTVPEPGSILLLGTGLIGSAGALFRKMRA
jgi:hypothetical protein